MDSSTLIGSAMALDLLDPFDAILALWFGTGLCPTPLFSLVMRRFSNLARLSIVDSLTLIHSLMALDLSDPSGAIWAPFPGLGYSQRDVPVLFSCFC